MRILKRQFSLISNVSLVFYSKICKPAFTASRLARLVSESLSAIIPFDTFKVID